MLRQLLRFLRRLIFHAWRAVRWTIGLFLFLMLIQYSSFPLGLRWNAVAVMTSDHQFDYLAWEIDAIASKAAQVLWGVQPYMSEEDRSQTVRDYMADMALAQDLENQVNAVFSDPNVSDAQAASADLRAERDSLRADLRSRQPLMEAILEGQVAAVLVDEGFGVAGQLIPPIAMHFTQVPNLLIVSPRDQIRFEVSINLDPMPIDEIAALEDRIDTAQDVSTLIVPLGGIALYPAMILETSNLRWAIETFSHEWSHHYFFMYPLGLSYDFMGEARIINETVADLFGKEIAQSVMARYYPELVTQAENVTVGTQNRVSAQQQTPDFDFGYAMNQTRMKVDHYMAHIAAMERKRDLAEIAGSIAITDAYTAITDGLIDEVEAYMEARREIFYANGYQIRKLNQAYFAFYGGYQGGIAGIGGEDPIGPAVRDIRAMSPTIHDWIVTLRSITSRDELIQVRDAMEAEQQEEF